MLAPSDALTALVLQSALLEPHRAVQAWSRATDLMPLEDWPSALVRPLPRIYLNLRHQQGFSHHAIMRGIYRAAWSANMVKLSRASAVCAELERRGLDHRIVKGGAVCSWLDTWGSRRMGDLDLVVPTRTWIEVEAVLRECGFAPRFPAPSGPTVGTWDDGHGGVLDVHAVDERGSLHALSLGRPVCRAPAGSHRLAIPDVDACVAIAVGHARLGVAESDRVQGLLDLAALEQHADPRAVISLLEVSGSLETGLEMLTTLREIGWEPSQEWPLEEAAARAARSRGSGERRRAMPRGLAKASRVVRHRGRSPLRLLRSQVWLGRQPLYLGWLSLGQPRPLEARLLARIRPLMPLPREALPVGEDVRVPFDWTPRTERHVTGWNAATLDRRFALRVAQPGRVRLVISLPDGVQAPNRRMLFLNGRVYGYFPVDDAREATYEVDAPRGFIEGSLRAPGDADAQWLDSLIVRLRD